MEAIERAHILHGRIRTVGDYSAAFEQRAPNIRPLFGTAWSEPAKNEHGVGRAMDALHRGDDAQLGKTRDIGGVQVLCMFDPPTAVFIAWVSPESFFEDIQRFAVGPIADRMDAKLAVIQERQAGRFANRLD